MTVGGFFLFLFTLPWTLTVAWPYPVLACLFGFASWKSLRMGPGLVLRATWRPWFAARWKYSTTIGRGIVYQPDHVGDGKKPTRIEAHEQIHIQQCEDLAVSAFILAGFVCLMTRDVVTSLLLWWSFGVWHLFNYVGAAVRYGWRNAYRDSEHERSAYARTDPMPATFVGRSWEEYRATERVLEAHKRRILK